MSGLESLAVECRQLTYHYGHVAAVGDVTLHVESGETLGCSAPTVRERRLWSVCSPR